MTEEISRSLFGEGSGVMIYIYVSHSMRKESKSELPLLLQGETRNECDSIILTALLSQSLKNLIYGSGLGTY